jgi:hypothetical protein
MNYYKNDNNKVFAYDDEQVAQGYGADFTAITEEEAVALANPPKTFEQSMEELRIKRNNLLLETDWTANSDVTMSEAMTTYRQSLRDITNGLTTVEQVNAVVFPEKPTE